VLSYSTIDDDDTIKGNGDGKQVVEKCKKGEKWLKIGYYTLTRAERHAV